jgi:hypothetical protein
MTDLQRHLPAENIEKMSGNESMRKFGKSPEQGAATTVWAAAAKEWEGKGGKYLEDCGVSEPVCDNPQGLASPGYKPYAYDEEGAKRLWKLSAEMTGVEE